MNEQKHYSICKRDNLGKFFQLQPVAQSEQKSFLLQIADKVDSIATSPLLAEFLRKEKSWGIEKRTMTATVDDKEMDLMLHWVSDNRQGFFSSFR